MVQLGWWAASEKNAPIRTRIFRGMSFHVESTEVTEMQCVIPLLGVYLPQGSKCLALNAKLPQIIARAGIPATRKQGASHVNAAAGSSIIDGNEQ